jgi:RNA polymerase sigma factor (TIGR02999 family)
MTTFTLVVDWTSFSSHIWQRVPVSTVSGDVTRLLSEIRNGKREAEAQLIPLVYADLRRIAAANLRRERPNHSLQPTALVHEAYMRLAYVESNGWQDRAHFYAVASTVMRHILVDHARANKAKKRGDGQQTIEIHEGILGTSPRVMEVLVVDEALRRLATLDERQSKIVELRFFSGMTEEEAGDVLGISVRTVKRDWRIARAWLVNELGG